MHTYLLLQGSTLTLINLSGETIAEALLQKSRDGIMVIQSNGFKRWFSLNDKQTLPDLIDSLSS